MSDRKYRHRGYQDDGDREPQARRTPRQRRDPTLRPGGRGLGKPTATVFRCAVCGTQVSGDAQTSGDVGFESTCPKCKADLHTCTHCAHFDSSASNECRKPGAEYVASKAKRNHCELFEAKAAQEFAKEAAPKSARDAFDALFK